MNCWPIVFRPSSLADPAMNNFWVNLDFCITYGHPQASSYKYGIVGRTAVAFGLRPKSLP